jgi:hypothetical protein
MTDAVQLTGLRTDLTTLESHILGWQKDEEIR